LAWSVAPSAADEEASTITLLLQQAGGVPETTERRIEAIFYFHDVCLSLFLDGWNERSVCIVRYSFERLCV
jgi:hypothetical protein